MNTLDALLEALHAAPADDATRLVLADWLEEQGQAEQAELLRLHLQLRKPWDEHGPPSPLFTRLCKLLRQGVSPVVPVRTNSLGMSFALIPPGVFWMGSPQDEDNRFPDEGPEHLVRITRPFYLGIFPVTQAEYEAVAEFNPSSFHALGDGAEAIRGLDTFDHPVENVTWEEASEFCSVLNLRAAELLAGRRYRLPTEAEWEYACRAGISRAGPYHWGSTISPQLANIRGWDEGQIVPGKTHIERTCPVDAYPPNAFGLYDLHGNVSEWCSDWFEPDYYERSPIDDPQGPEDGEYRILRGGCWKDSLDFSRTAFRYDRPPEQRRNDFGFRIVLEYPAPRDDQEARSASEGSG